MSGWTPGPWAVQVAEPMITSRATAYEIVTDGFDVVGGRVGIRSAADACLIAASPDMADALRQWQHAEETGDDAELANARKSRDMALAKARGEGGGL